MASKLRLPGLLLAIVCGAAPWAAASAQTFDITGVWRDQNAQNDDKTTPRKAVLPELSEFRNNFHGTYVSRPYLLISLQDPGKPTGPYFMYSDMGDLRAELRPAAGAPADLDVIDRRSGRKLAVMRTNADACGGLKPCFVFDNAAGELSVPVAYAGLPVRYVPVGIYNPSLDLPLDQTFGNMFSPLSANFAYILKCWSLATMNPVDYQKPGCYKDIFSMPPPKSFGYSKVGFNNWKDAAVPFAWTYASTIFQNGEDRGRTWENGQDVAQADMLKIGVKVSVNVMGVDASSHVSVATHSKVEDMYNSKLTYSKAEYLATEFALMLNKYYAGLDPDLTGRIQTIRTLPESQRAPEYERLVIDYGTHYANAITFGAKGERQLKMTQSQVQTMAETQTDVSVGITAGYGGSSGSVDVDTSKKNMEKITNNTSAEDRTWICYSGGSCNDGIPSLGAAALPVQLDLRPLSDLLAPPFFSDDEVITTMRDGVSRAVAKAAFVQRDGLQMPTALFATLTGFIRHNLQQIGANPMSTTSEAQPCGAASVCRDGTLTLKSADGGSVTELAANAAQQPLWRIPATLNPKLLAPDGYVEASYTMSGRCLGGNGTWSTPASAGAAVNMPDLSLRPAGNETGIAFINSPSCVTGDNPMGFITVMTGAVQVVDVRTARSLLEKP